MRPSSRPAHRPDVRVSRIRLSEKVHDVAHGKLLVRFHRLIGRAERIKARGAEFTMPPTDVTGSTIAMLNDTCGNLIQLTQLARYSR